MGSALALTGASTFYVVNKHAPFIRPVNAAEMRKSHTKGTTDSEPLNHIETHETTHIEKVERTDGNILNPKEFTKCQVVRTEYETPNTKRLTIKCPIGIAFSQAMPTEHSDAISFTHFVTREPEGNEKKVYPIIDDKSNTDDSKPSLSFEILVQREKMCKNSTFLHSIYPDELCEIKGPFNQHFPAASAPKEETSKEKSTWEAFFGGVRQKYKMDEPGKPRRYFIASGTEGISQVYSSIRKALKDDKCKGRSVDNFLLYSADSTAQFPLIQELGNVLKDRLSDSTEQSSNQNEFYQYFTLNQPQWGWQGGCGKIDAQLLNGIIGKGSSNRLTRRDVSVFVAGDNLFKSNMTTLLEKDLHFDQSAIHIVE